MSLDSNRKILMGSVSQSLDKRTILGDDVDNESIVLLSMLINYVEYCMVQYNAGNSQYFNKIKILNQKIHALKYKCPDICVYKDRLIITKLNTPPSIDNNTIELPISNNYQTLPYNEVIHNYSDAENDLISKVIILSKDIKNDLLIDNSPVIINNVYEPNINFSAKYENGTGNIFIVQNTGTNPCTSNIISINETSYNEAIQNHNVVNINDGAETVLQSVVNEVESLPNDTIIYVHIDTSSMSQADQLTIKDVTLVWWAQFQIDNPDFEGSLLINTVPNDQISTDFAVGRGSNGRTAVSGSTITPGVEAWLENPAEGLLRQAYKEGENTFPNEAAFQTYIENKSIVVLTFVDETHSEYHGYSSGVGFNDPAQNIYQPTPTYITNYNDYLFKVRPYLKFFKGVLYPITRVNNISNDNFQLHALGAMEATVLTPTQIDAAFGVDKVAAYGATNMQTKYYDNLGTINPYSNLNGLKASGWEGRFDKTSPASEVLNSQEFSDELNEILTNTENVNVSFVETINIPSNNLGSEVETDFNLKVRDNNPVQPLYSNEANIKLKYSSDCEVTPECKGETTQLNTNHKDTYIFTPDDFTVDSGVDKVKIESVNIPNGQLKYFNLTITSSNTPLVINIEDILNGDLTYVPDSTIQESYQIDIVYSLSYEGSINYCISENTLELIKLENPNKPPTITTEDKNIEFTFPILTGTTTINTTVNYNGTGGYYTFWSRVSGASDVQMINPTEESLQLANLKNGTYQFKITVITIEDNFIVEANSTVTVTVINQGPTVDAGASDSITLPINSSSATATATDNDGTINTIVWSQVSGPNTATVSDTSTLTPSFTNLIEGTYVFQITVTDNSGDIASDTMQITVLPNIIQPS